MADSNEWTSGGAKQQLGRIKRHEANKFDVAIVHPEGLGQLATNASLSLMAGSKTLFSNPVEVIDEAHSPNASGSIELNMEDPFFDSKPIKSLLDDWGKLIRGDHEEPTGTDIITYCVPWDNKTPEGAYLNSNHAFAEGATLPRGKCRRKFGNKPITKTKFKNCKVQHTSFSESDNTEVEINVEFGEIDAK